MTINLQILLQSYPWLSICLPQVNREFTKSIRLKYLLDICPLFMKLFLFTFTTGIGQMIFFEKHLWGTASAAAMDICLTKD